MTPAATLRRHGHDNRHRQPQTEKSRPPRVATSSSSSSSSSSSATSFVVESPAATAAAAAAFLPQPAPPRHGRPVLPPQQQHQQGIVNTSHTKHRLTYAIQQMKEVCPQHIATYASCVLSYNGTVTTMDVPVGGGETKYLMKQSFCSEEFRQVKECFRQLRG